MLRLNDLVDSDFTPFMEIFFKDQVPRLQGKTAEE